MGRDSSWELLGSCQPGAGGPDVGTQGYMFREKPWRATNQGPLRNSFG